MSLDLARLDAMMSRDAAAGVDRHRPTEMDPHSRELGFGATSAYSNSSAYGVASQYNSSATTAGGSHWHGGAGSYSNMGAPYGGGAASYGGGVASHSAAATSGSVVLPPAIDDLGLPRSSLPVRKAGLTRSVPSLVGRRGKAQQRNTDATWDVETLQELVMSYKRKVSELEKGRRLLRSQYQKAQERVLAKDREIDTILQKVAGGAALMSEKSMIRTLKHQVRTLQDSLSERSAEIDKLRSMVKFTQLEEMRIYCEDFAQELRRLRLFNELGRAAEAHVTIPVLEEIRSLRQECGALKRDNADLANRLTQTELTAEQSRARDRKQFAERIQKMEGELRQERALVAEMEKISDLTRAELGQVVAQTDTTRIALADSSTQIRLLRERVASQEAELHLQKAASANAAEKSAKDLSDLLALKESMEKKLLAERAELHESLERQRAAIATLQESECLLQGTVIDLRRIGEETTQKARADQQHLLEKLQQKECQMDVIEGERKLVKADLTSLRAELEQSTVALRQSQQNYEHARAELFALEKELLKVKADAEVATAARIAEMSKQEADLQAQQKEVERLRAINEEAAKKFSADLDDALLRSDANDPISEKEVDHTEAKPEGKNDEPAKSEEPVDNATDVADTPAHSEEAIVNLGTVEDIPKFGGASDDPKMAVNESASPEVQSEIPKQPEENETSKKPNKERRGSKPRADGDKGNSEKSEKHSGKTEKSRDKTDKEKSDKEKSKRSSSKTDKRSDKKPSTKRVSSKPA